MTFKRTVVIERREAVKACVAASLCGVVVGALLSFIYTLPVPDDRFDSMCQMPKRPGEGMFITMTRDFKYNCWDNLK